MKSMFVTLALLSATMVSRTTLAQSAPAAQPAQAQSSDAPAQPAMANTEATRSVEQTPSPAVRERTRRINSVRAACRETRRVDAFGVVAVPVFAISGLSLSVLAFSTPPMERTNVTAFMGSLGPGLVLGAIGVPFGRGWIGAIDPLRNGCDRVMAEGATDEADLVGTEGLLRAFGAPASPVLPIIVGVATVAVGAGTAAAFALDNRDLVQAMGGIAAFVVAGWALVPPTPNLQGARGYVSGRFVQDVSVGFTGTGLSVGGRF